MRHKYIKVMLENIFQYGKDIIDLPDNSGYVEFIEDVLKFFPIHQNMKALMNELDMNTIGGTNILVYGGAHQYDKNWYYLFFDTDNILDFINGQFSFQMALNCEIDNEVELQKVNVEVKDYKINNMYIDMGNEDVWIIKNGKELWK